MRGQPIDAVLFDYGGVLAEVLSPEDGFERMAAFVLDTLPTRELTLADVSTDLRFGWKAYGGWKTAQSRLRAPREVSQQEFWDFVACDWNEADRAAVFANAVILTRQLELTVIERPAAPSTKPALLALRAEGVKLGLVSNCLSGDAARIQLEQDGLLDLFEVTVFSNEAGCRKPGPQIIELALRAMDVPVTRACFVGDRLDRDILAARRAQVALCVLKNAKTGSGAALRGVTPDATIDDLAELSGLLKQPSDL